MKSQRWAFAVAGCLLLAAASEPGALGRVRAAEASNTKIVFIPGPSTHPPGTHEVAAGARLLRYCIDNAENIQPARGVIYDRWPEDLSVLDDAATIVFTGDLFPPERVEQPDKAKAELATLMDRGCGIVCLHFATGLRAQHVAEDGDHPLLKWLGGYYASGCPHHRSIARVLTATISPAEVDHPVLRGWQEFTFDDEPYWNNYFGKDGPAENVTPLACSMLPPDKPNKEIVAWAVQRPDGGRGAGIVLPHYFRNWRVDDLRTLVLNSICWTAKLEVPPEGVKSPLPDLATFEPASVAPRPRPKR
jgi:hypothetical protein